MTGTWEIYQHLCLREAITDSSESLRIAKTQVVVRLLIMLTSGTQPSTWKSKKKKKKTAEEQIAFTKPMHFMP